MSIVESAKQKMQGLVMESQDLLAAWGDGSDS